jgi:hypothetical protein
MSKLEAITKVIEAFNDNPEVYWTNKDEAIKNLLAVINEDISKEESDYLSDIKAQIDERLNALERETECYKTIEYKVLCILTHIILYANNAARLQEVIVELIKNYGPWYVIIPINHTAYYEVKVKPVHYDSLGFVDRWFNSMDEAYQEVKKASQEQWGFHPNEGGLFFMDW